MPGTWHESGINRRDLHVWPIAAKTDSMIEFE
jgi:hypothetical protein